jgi:prolyl 4-hydroxylase
MKQASDATMMGFSYLSRCFLSLSALYLLQVICLLNINPHETASENGPSSHIPSTLLAWNIASSKQQQQREENQSNAGGGVIIRQQENNKANTAITSKASGIIATKATEIIEEAPVFVTDLGVRQVIDDLTLTSAIKDRVAQARIYLHDIVAVNTTYDKVRSFCKNRKEFCASYAVRGQCDINPAMKFECAPVCASCEQMDVDVRCRVDPDAVDAFYPGDLDRRYENITTNPAFEQFGRKVLSRPSYAPGDTVETADYQLGPWMVVFDNALSDEEADRIIELGSNVGFEHSTGVGKQKKDGSITNSRDSRRTSTTAWCMADCAQDPTVQKVMNRIATITGIGETNYEHLQILRYEKGQYYKTHNDFIDYQQNRSSGARLLTFYVYLSDVDEGGGTKFPHLNLTVSPKKGRAVLWPSVLNHDPNSKDNRTNHAALAVNQGIKYGFNAWIHQRDFKSSHERNCQ